MRDCLGVNATVSARGHGANQSGFERRHRNDGRRGVSTSFRHRGPVQRLAINGFRRPTFSFSCLVGGTSNHQIRLEWSIDNVSR
jgi:hypothetical protein